MASNGRLPYSTPSPSNDFLCTTNNSFLTEGLLKIYHDSFENALSCWLTERTCPYSKGSDVSLANDTGPDWNRIYHRVFRLDRLASPIRGRNLTFQEDKAASKALNLAIFSFATQWAQSSERSKAKYPFHSDRQDDQYRVFNANASESISTTRSNFDRTLQISAWREARLALQNATEIDSFRVVLAQIVFSLAQRPMELNDKGQLSDNSIEQSSVQAGSDDESMSECEDLLSKLDLTIEEEGPPIHLEQGLRLIHSLRSRMAMSGRMQTPPSRIWSSRCGKPPKSSHNRLDAADRATVDLLFWLGVMFDTLSSAMHKRPLVVSDEDSDIYSSTPRPTSNDVSNNSPSLRPPRDQATETQGLWDDYLFAHQRKRLSGNLVRWPCPHEQATSLLCDAAPVKVLLFRKVTRIQTLLSRNVKGERVERAVKAALDVYNHWATLYAPFIGDCIQNHDSLPARIQSWYICLTSHWHLATLLLADLIEITDTSELGVDSVRRNRMSSDFVATFRETNCCALSDIARCACPRDDATFAKSSGFHFAVNQGALLTEPWTAVVIRAFAKAGVILLESETLLTPQLSIEGSKEEAFRRADDCVRALWYLGRKSDMALNAAKILGDALKQRRKGAEEKMNDMSSFLQAELWEGFDEMGGAFGVECV
ncbi:hypothetical protein CC78DRAFT_523389 [Lojkania enalia]|uniref:Regulatory protein alcR n=1 Tax=Lojkania enalia TaxID=147567 RepID=A0A9P4N690_9PLEO|nr:hypothetical protein CC78DRAFT_523389 [Didymosphaeria enalia]